MGEGNGGRRWGCGLRSLVRRKQVDSAHSSHGSLLAKELSVLHLIAIGVGSTIGAGVYILVGTVAREHSGPALTFSFLVAGIAAALSAFCYAELASRCPSAGSAYHYSYICVGEGVAWLIGWALILEYTIGGSAVARGISPNLIVGALAVIFSLQGIPIRPKMVDKPLYVEMLLPALLMHILCNSRPFVTFPVKALLFGGADSLPSFLARQHIPGLDLVVDPCAAALVIIVTGLLCVGIKESTTVQAIVTTANVCAMTFVIVAGCYLGFKTGWPGYELSTGYFPFGVDGMLAGSATVFFAFIGFDSVASTAEEVKNPQRDLPLGIASALSICCALYMLVSGVIVGLVPYYSMDPDTPISSAFASLGMKWAAYIITVGAVMALCSTLMGSMLPQPRILMAMARDGLLPPFFSDVNKNTLVPIKSTISTGICAAVLAFFMDVSQLAGMVSVGTLLAFTMVAISVLILRYVPPDEVPLPSSLQDSIDSVALRYISQDIYGNDPDVSISTFKGDAQPLLNEKEITFDYPLIVKKVQERVTERNRRIIAGWTIMFTCIGAFVLTFAASSLGLPSSLRFSLCGVSGTLLLSGLVVLTIIDQDEGRHSFGHSGGFICPLVPLLPIVCILINLYLLINLGPATWARVSVWLMIGAIIYVFYGRNHSSLLDAVYVPAAHVEEICRNSGEALA